MTNLFALFHENVLLGKNKVTIDGLTDAKRTMTNEQRTMKDGRGGSGGKTGVGRTGVGRTGAGRTGVGRTGVGHCLKRQYAGQ